MNNDMMLFLDRLYRFLPNSICSKYAMLYIIETLERLSTSRLVFNPFYHQNKSLLRGIKSVSTSTFANETNMCNFRALGVVVYASETRLQVDENSSKITYRGCLNETSRRLGAKGSYLPL